MSDIGNHSQSNIIDINENKEKQIKNIRALLSKFLHVNLIGGLPTRYESAFYHQKRDSRTLYEIDTHDPSSIAHFVNEMPKRNRNYHVSLAPIILPNDPTHEEPKTLFILDLDVNHDGSSSDGIETFNQQLKHFFPEKTFSIRTKSGGLHLYFYTSIEFVREYDLKKVVNFLDGIDILSSNADPSKMYSVIGPGSYSTFEGHTKANKTRYAIKDNLPILPLPIKFVDYLKEKRESYTSWHKEELALLKQNSHSNVAIDDKENIKAAKSYISDLIIEANAHYRNNLVCKYSSKRNDSLNRFAYHLATYALSDNTFEELARSINENVFRDSLSEDEFQTTIKSALEARKNSGETSLNAESDLPDFQPFVHRDITYDEIIPRARLVDRVIFEKLQSSQRGLKILTSTLFQTESHACLVKLPPLDRTLNTFQLRIEDIDYITYAELTTLIRNLEMKFVMLRNKENLNNYIGPVDIPASNERGRPRKAVITNHPYFEAAVRRGVDFSYDSSKDFLLKDDRLHPISPPPLSLLPKISEEEYQKQLPFIEEILEHFRQTVTDSRYPEEFNYLLNFIAAMCQRKQVQAFIVLHGPQGTGKSQFLKFLSLFVPEEDVTIARNPNAAFEKFANIGTLTTIDDCNLNETRELDALKARVSDDTHVMERKFMQASTVRKLVSIVAATNHVLTDIEFLHERRLIWFSSSAKYSGPEYLQIVNKQCRRLLANGAIALAALHRYFQDFKITIRDWNFKTHAHLNLIQQVEYEQSVDTDSTNKWRIARSINSKDREKREKEKIAVANLIANFGYLSPQVTNKLDIRVPLCTMFEDLQDYKSYHHFPQTSPDWLYILRYYYDLKDNKLFSRIQFEERLHRKDPKLHASITQFTHEMNKKHRPLADAAEEIYSPANKKIKPRIAERSIEQKRVMILPPVSSWFSRFSVLANGSVSPTLSNEMLKKLGLEEIVEFLKDRIEEPNKQECQQLFNKLFPNQVMGEFNVIQKDMDSDFFEEEEISDEFGTEDLNTENENEQS